MAEVLLFHHVHGLTDGCLAFADDLRAAGLVMERTLGFLEARR